MTLHYVTYKSKRVHQFIIFMLFIFAFWTAVVEYTGHGLTPISNLHSNDKHTEDMQIPIVYEKCMKIPNSPAGFTWPENWSLHEPKLQSGDQLPNVSFSEISLTGSSAVKLGDTIHVLIRMFDRLGRPRISGGDMIRVWMREGNLEASSVGQVTDNNNGTYSVKLTAFWTGSPEIVAALILSREILATALRRRYTCPPVLMNTAVFVHPVETDLKETTPCNYSPQVPGFQTLCNLTEDNYRRPWYCGKPRNTRLQCNDWVLVDNINLWESGNERQVLTDVEFNEINGNFGAKMFPNKLKITVTDDVSQSAMGQIVMVPEKKCNAIPKNETWHQKSPTGFVYKRKWLSRFCRGTDDKATFVSCLRNVSILMIGDSTVRQLFGSIQRITNCKMITDAWGKLSKHRLGACQVPEMNFDMTMTMHQLPFCTSQTRKQYLKSFNAHLNAFQGTGRRFIVIHVYAHYVNHHSHVMFETIRDMKKVILDFLNRNRNAFVFIKGPHAFSFAKDNHIMWMPDKYADIYTEMLYKEFVDCHDRVLFIDALDITVSTEQWHIHAEDYVINELLYKLLSYICPY